MKDTAPKSLGIIAVSALFGIIAAGVAYVLYEFGFAAGLGIGLLVALITAVVLMLGWRDPAPRELAPTGAPRAAAPAPQPAAAPAAAAAAAPAAAPEPVAEAPAPTPVSEPEPTAAPAPAPMEAAAPMVKETKPLPGEAELDAKKGEWKYDGPGTEQDAAPAAAEPASAGEAEKPQFLSEAREGGPDDLKQIKGVGKKLEETLHGMGIFHFDQIATWGPKEQAWIDDNLTGFKGRATRDNWVEQAKVLAAGGSTAFSDKVKGGDVY